MPLFLQIPHTVLRQSDTVFCLMISFWTILLPVLPFIPWLIRPDRPFVTALSGFRGPLPPPLLMAPALRRCSGTCAISNAAAPLHGGVCSLEKIQNLARNLLHVKCTKKEKLLPRTKNLIHIWRHRL